MLARIEDLFTEDNHEVVGEVMYSQDLGNLHEDMEGVHLIIITIKSDEYIGYLKSHDDEYIPAEGEHIKITNGQLPLTVSPSDDEDS